MGLQAEFTYYHDDCCASLPLAIPSEQYPAPWRVQPSGTRNDPVFKFPGFSCLGVFGRSAYSILVMKGSIDICKELERDLRAFVSEI